MIIFYKKNFYKCMSCNAEYKRNPKTKKFEDYS